MSGIVYLHTNKLNGKVYVGQTWKTLGARSENGKAYSANHYFAAAIRKYGWDGFDHQTIVEADTQERLDNLEKIWIILLRATDRKFGYNLMSGGSHGRHSEETRKKLSAYFTGKPLGEEHCQKISFSLKGNKRAKGYKHSEEAKRKTSEKMKGNSFNLGYKHSEETKTNMSRASKIRGMSEICRKARWKK